MLNEFYKSDEHLKRKIKHIVITNVCNLSCGGCHQNCGNFSKEKLWFIDEIDFENYIKILKSDDHCIKINNQNYITKISIFGGEPTIHPKWNKLVEIMHKHDDVLFRVSTNGRLFKSPQNPFPNLPINVGTLKSIIEIEKHPNQKITDNIVYIIDPKDDVKVKNYSFVPTFIAPIDIYPKKSKNFFWYKAQKDCGIWKHCSSAIYNKKGYFCEVAGAMDHLFYNGENGWEINDKTFIKTPEEIEKQAEKFCYRCSWCLKFDTEVSKFVQKIDQPSLVSITNAEAFKEANVSLVNITLPKKDSPDLNQTKKQ